MVVPGLVALELSTITTWSLSFHWNLRYRSFYALLWKKNEQSNKLLTNGEHSHKILTNGPIPWVKKLTSKILCLFGQFDQKTFWFFFFVFFYVIHRRRKNLCFLEKKSDQTHSIFYLKGLVLHFVDFLNNIRIVMENLIYIQFFNKIFILASPQKAQKTFRKCDFRSAFLNNRKRFHLLFYGRFLRAHKKTFRIVPFISMCQ